MRLIPLRASLAWLALLLGGCAETSQHVMFVTKASIGVDVETTTATTSFAYDRVEGYYAPHFAGQEPAPVYASLATNGKMIDRKIKQVYATGNAAKIVSAPSSQSQARAGQTGSSSSSSSSAGNSSKDSTGAGGAEGPATSMFFGTGTVLGLKLGFSATSLDSFTLGYKRKELSIIPRQASDNGAFPSVIASFDSDQAATTLQGSNMGIKQFFATGSAAESLAGNEQIRTEFEQEALSNLAVYREDERQQQRLALSSLGCLSQLNDEQSRLVWKNVQALELFDPPALDKLRSATSVGAARTVYTAEIGITKGTSNVHTALMRAHRAYVCELRSPT